MDIASSTQLVFETIFIKILNKLYDLNNSNSICISGGCAMNSLMNGKIIEKTKYKNIYINHSPGDSGGSMEQQLLQLKIKKRILLLKIIHILDLNLIMKK